MKKILSILLALLWLLPQGIAAFAGAPAAEGTVKAPQDLSTTYMKRWHEGKCMPSIGSVKLPVILVDFDGCRMDESFREACDNYFNAEYNPELAEEGPFAQSVRGAFQKLSYGRLDLTADILPIYHCENPASAYNSTMAEGCALVEEIIASYTEQGILQK